MTQMRATSIHTGSFPPEAPRRLSWRQRADSIRVSVQRRLSLKTALSEEQGRIDEVVQALTPKEQDTAARMNYQYLLDPNDESLKKQSMRAAVQRVLRSKNHSVTRTLQALRSTLSFRQKINVDGLRLAFAEEAGSSLYEPLAQHLSAGMVYVQGYDKEGRSTYVFEPHRVTNSPDELDWTIRMHVYTLERAIACSKCPEKSVNAVVNFQNFSIRKHKPPMELGIEFMQTLRCHYSGYVHQIFLVDAPSTFLCLWTVLAPFLAAKTKKKIHFVSGNKQKTKLVGDLYDNDQVPSWLLPQGTLNRAFSPQLYLRETPFDKTCHEL